MKCARARKQACAQCRGRGYIVVAEPNFAGRLRSQRERLGLTQDACAVLLGVSGPLVSLLENGKRQPSLRTVVRAAQTFGKSVDYMLGIGE